MNPFVSYFKDFMKSSMENPGTLEHSPSWMYFSTKFTWNSLNWMLIINDTVPDNNNIQLSPSVEVASGGYLPSHETVR